MKPYNEREKSNLFAQDEVLEIEKIKDETFAFIKEKTFSNTNISVDLQIYITDRFGKIVCKDRYLSLL